MLSFVRLAAYCAEALPTNAARGIGAPADCARPFARCRASIPDELIEQLGRAHPGQRCQPPPTPRSVAGPAQVPPVPAAAARRIWQALRVRTDNVTNLAQEPEFDRPRPAGFRCRHQGVALFPAVHFPTLVVYVPTLDSLLNNSCAMHRETVSPCSVWPLGGLSSTAEFARLNAAAKNVISARSMDVVVFIIITAMTPHNPISMRAPSAETFEAHHAPQKLEFILTRRVLDYILPGTNPCLYRRKI